MGKSQKKSGKSQKGPKKTNQDGRVPIRNPPPLKPPRLGALDLFHRLSGDFGCDFAGAVNSNRCNLKSLHFWCAIWASECMIWSRAIWVGMVTGQAHLKERYPHKLLHPLPMHLRWPLSVWGPAEHPQGQSPPILLDMQVTSNLWSVVCVCVCVRVCLGGSLRYAWQHRHEQLALLSTVKDCDEGGGPKRPGTYLEFRVPFCILFTSSEVPHFSVTVRFFSWTHLQRRDENLGELFEGKPRAWQRELRGELSQYRQLIFSSKRKQDKLRHSGPIPTILFNSSCLEEQKHLHTKKQTDKHTQTHTHTQTHARAHTHTLTMNESLLKSTPLS